MYYYGQNYGYPQQGYACQAAYNNSSWGGVFAVILVLFILLVIIGWGGLRNGNNASNCGF